MIVFDHASKVYPNGTVGLKDVTLTIQDGEFVAIIGRSGAGKSTLLRSVNRMHDITEGRLTVEGVNVSTLKGKDLRRFRRGIGMVFQSFNLVTRTTVIRNVLAACVPEMPFWRVLLGAFRKQDKLTALESLDKVGILDKAYIRADQLSGGQQQRVALARAIVTEPKVLLLDEPLSAIDAKLRRNLQVEIRRIQQDFGMTTIFVTHDQDEAMVMSDVIHLFYQGNIEQSGSPTDMYTQPVSKFAASFIGNYNILTAAEFQKASGEAVDSSDVAIRPEIVRINLEVADESTRYHMEGKVIDSLSHGNLMRYTILCNGVEINADIMFEKSHLLEIGQKVRLSIRKSNVIMLDH